MIIGFFSLISSNLEYAEKMIDWISQVGEIFSDDKDNAIDILLKNHLVYPNNV